MARRSNERPGGGVDRRTFLRVGTAAAGATWLGRASASANPRSLVETSGAPGPELVRYPQKTDLILHTDRPPNLEMPGKYLRDDFTPNEAFFVRWHLGVIPTSVDTAAFRLNVGGHVAAALGLSLADLRKGFEPASVVAVNQCSGNSRSFFAPRVPGGQWGNGAIGNARWTGVRLRDLLAKAGLKPGALEVSFQGLDRGPMPTVPDFVKSLPIDVARGEDVLVAYEMNGQALPMLNGFPLRLIVPGWFATYWVKSLTEINVLDQKFRGFWMEKGYRVPDNPEMAESPGALAKQTVSISTMPVRSLFAAPGPDQRLRAGEPAEVQGVALDDGAGIRRVEVSTDGGNSWADAKLDPELGKYAWRRWRFAWSPKTRGRYTLQARATNAAGKTQSRAAHWNRSGYGRNVIESLNVVVD